jgi:hypothetical protein
MYLYRPAAGRDVLIESYSGGPEPDDVRRWLMPEPETAGE